LKINKLLNHSEIDISNNLIGQEFYFRLSVSESVLT